jgi:anti-sigma regulatory factor (Ser/Thr protein kinase)
VTAEIETASRPHTGYRHEAFLYRGDDDFLAGTVPFVRDGVAAGQPVMVAVIAARGDRLREALGSDAEQVHFVDMSELGRNPARIIPAWRAFVDGHQASGQPVRGIGEPIWAGRRAAEIVECQLHEALLNMALDPDTPLWLRCPYDVDALDGLVRTEAERSHPVLVENRAYIGSTVYGGAHHAAQAFDRDLPEPAGPTDDTVFDNISLGFVRDIVRAHARVAQLTLERTEALALAVHELATNSVQHGGGVGRLRVWHQTDALVCQVGDHGRVVDPLVGRRTPGLSQERGRGVWLANQLCDLVQFRSSEKGTTVRVSTWL